MRLRHLLLLPFVILFFQACAPAASPFDPTEDTNLDAGEYTFTEFNLASGVNLTLNGDVVIHVEGPITIEGNISGKCTALELRGNAELTIDGGIDTSCGDPDPEGADVRLVAEGDIILGSFIADEEIVVSDGELIIADSIGEAIDLIPIESAATTSSLRTFSPHLASPQKQGGAVTKINRPVRAGHGTTVSRESAEINADITAGNGADAAPIGPTAGDCTNTNVGGTGGSIRLYARTGTLKIGDGVTLTAGNGGQGGNCSATGCPAEAKAGQGGNGGSVLLGAQVIEFGTGVTLIRGNGGMGGEADALGDDGEDACDSGCPATSTGGLGGEAGGIGYLVLEPGRIDGSPGVDGANGGEGGVSLAIGGDGQDCDVCPGGAGGAGGEATATGGQGGNGATGTISGWTIVNGSHLKGSGGNAIVLGGVGGNGATCCTPPVAGGNGGAGGDATAIGGQIGAKGVGGGGVRGSSGDFAGDGLDGGDGDGPGLGGAEGIGSGDPDPVADGLPGLDGQFCPLTSVGQIYLVTLIIFDDPAGHGPFIDMPEALELEVIIKLEQGLISIFGPFPWIELHGTIDDEGNFVVFGEGTVAGFPGIDVVLEGFIDPRSLSGQMTMGGKGGLPTGAAIIYTVEGENISVGPSSESADQGLVRDFVDNLQKAMAVGDMEFLAAALNPEVYVRYGEEACLSRLPQFIEMNPNIQFVKVLSFGSWDYASDGVSTAIPDTYTVAVNQTVDGERQRLEGHFALIPGKLDGSLSFFADCGDRQ